MKHRRAEGRHAGARARRPGRVRARLRHLAEAIASDDESAIEAAVTRLSHSRPALAPVAFVTGALLMLLHGLRAAFGGRRLFLVETLPAAWVWIAMLDLKLHLLHGQAFRDWLRPGALIATATIVAVTVAAYWLSTVFAFALSSGDGRVRPAFTAARAHLGSTAAMGLVAGAALAAAAVVSPRWGRLAFSLSLSAAVGILMVTLVAFPARVVGISARAPRRDRWVAAAVAGTVSALVCIPAYTAGRLGTFFLGSGHLFALGVVLVALGYLLEVGASCAVKTVEMSAKLVGGGTRHRAPPAPGPPAHTPRPT